MTDEPQPDLRWAPLEPKPSNRGRVWLIVGLVIAALVIVGVLLFFLLPRAESPAPGASGSPSPSASPSVSPSTTQTPAPSPTQTDAPQPTAEPTMTPITTPPPVADPSLDAFRAQVQGWLDDAPTGLEIVSETSGQEALSVLETLQSDAQRLAETAAPASIASSWSAGVSSYSQKLTELRSAVNSGASTEGAVAAARASADELRALVGL
ncbi:hypothetical protein [Microbacterium sp. WCS2018Hpa-9]|uniref:hypothetical protein n=1 Tax=Microbacterium sp. WCS2018Hpa-9 TaxID=3073635 RepID=UPI00288B7964|nr:hypothetical protein [Microbacterium sp. WCS2018Hpa-9]